jgi:class 3 adenylate cyclase/tetratricopeptide (TPR) repeat protein
MLHSSATAFYCTVFHLHRSRVRGMNFTLMQVPGAGAGQVRDRGTHMVCSLCQAENPAEARYCNACGGSLALTCRHCNSANRRSARFCGNCGKSLSGSQERPAPGDARPAGQLPAIAAPVPSSRFAAEGERKQVTILFADIRGSTEIVFALDPEQAMQRLDPVVEIMSDAIRRHGGIVNRPQGDGIMALFGAPQATEDHAVRACCAARAMLDGVRALGRPELQIRVGINSGAVVVRPISKEVSFEYDAAGFETHVASRIEQIAPPGRALLTARTFRLAGGLILAKPLGACKLRGIEAPLDLYELVSVLDRPRWDAWASTRPLSRYVGRDAEMQMLAMAARHAGAGRGRAVAVRGDAGMGKSRLIHEFCATEPVRQWTRLRACAAAVDRATPYRLASDLIRAWIGANSADTPYETERRLEDALLGQRGLENDMPALRSLLSLPIEDAGWIQSDPQERRRRLLRAIQMSLLRSVAVRPTLVVLEDLHWADVESLAALDVLLDGLVAGKLLIVATGRPTWHPSWDNRDNSLSIHLGPLEGSAAHELVSDLLDGSAELAALRMRLVEECDATPLFLEEMTRMLLDSGVVVRGRSAYRLMHDPDQIHIPDSLQALLAERIDRLSVEYREVLQVASVVGRTFSLTVLRDVARLPEDQVYAALQDLQTMDFVYQNYHGQRVEFCFKHALTQTAAYDGMLLRERRELHARVLDSLKMRNGTRLNEYTEQLAHHALRAELWSDALGYFRRAGKDANDVSAHDVAIPHFEHALAALDHLPADRENASLGIDIRLGLRVALAATADLGKIRDCLKDAERHATELDDQERLALIRGSQCTIFTLLGDLSDAVPCGLSSRSIAQSIGHDGLRISAAFALGQAYSFSGELDKAIAVISEDLPLVLGDMRHVRLGTTGTPSVLCLASLANSHSLAGDLASAFARAADARQIASESGRAYDLSFSNVAQGLALLTRGDVAEAIEALEDALGHCRSGRLRILLPSVARFLGQAYIAVGRASDACALLEEAVTIARERGILAFQAWCGVWLGFAFLYGGCHQNAEAVGSETLSIAQQCGLRPIEAQTLRLLGEVHAHRHAIEPARKCFESAVKLTAAMGMRPEEAQARLGLGQAHRRAGKIAAAQSEFVAATNLFHSLGMIVDARGALAIIEEASADAGNDQPEGLAAHIVSL